jgi:hypothetical protein
MRCAICVAAWLVALGLTSCGDSETSTGTGTGGAGGTGGSGGVGAADGGPADGDAGVSADQACSETANALCSKYATCAPIVLTVLFGDMATCTSVAKAGCLGSLEADKTAATPEGFQKCSQDLETVGCADILSHKPPASCQPQGGTVGNGMACGDDWQCASGRCNIPDNATCGVCASRAAGGAACPNTTDDDCEFGLVCNNMVCVVPGVAGASCDANHPCAAPLVCNGATIAGGLGTCAAGGALGAPCSNDQSCSLIEGLWCTREMNRACAKVGAAETGMPCGLLSVSEYSLCKGGGAEGGCTVGTGMVMGTCPRLAMPGEPCSATTPCKAGGKCLNGLCTVREPSACR